MPPQLDAAATCRCPVSVAQVECAVIEGDCDVGPSADAVRRRQRRGARWHGQHRDLITTFVFPAPASVTGWHQRDGPIVTRETASVWTPRGAPLAVSGSEGLRRLRVPGQWIDRCRWCAFESLRARHNNMLRAGTGVACCQLVSKALRARQRSTRTW